MIPFFNHRKIYYWCLVLILVSLPLSLFALSVGMISLTVNWILEGHFKTKWAQLKKSPALYIFFLIYLLHLVGLIYSSDFSYAIKDIRIKLPLFILPLVIGTSESLSFKQWHRLLLWFTASVVAATLISTAVLLKLTPIPVEDIRDISIFISHIRFSLMINLALFSLLYFVFKPVSIYRKYEKMLYGVVILWLAAFLFLLKAFTGIIIFGVLLFAFSIYYTFKIKNFMLKWFLQIAILGVVLVVASYLTHAVARYYSKDPWPVSHLEEYTAKGNPYYHNKKNKQVENGHYVYLYICEKELRKAWEAESNYPYDSLDDKGQELKYTLFRYLTSKNLRKDAGGLNKLSNQDIRNIEKGMANHIFANNYSLYPRIYQLIWQIDIYRTQGYVSGHSLAQRFVYWETGWQIFKENPWIGVGTGDVQTEFDRVYNEMGVDLPRDRRRRAHNQYLTFMLTFGGVGFLIFLFALIYPVCKTKIYKHYLFNVFFLIALLSMLNEDTLETHTGVSFFIVFYAIYIYGIDYSGMLQTNETAHDEN